jgi:hypothetical protein
VPKLPRLPNAVGGRIADALTISIMPSDPSKSPPSNLNKEYPKLMWVGFGINPHHHDIVHSINK